MIWAASWENLFMPYANNKGADQPAHPRSLISTFVVRCLDSIIPLLAIAEISRLELVSVAEQASLSLTWSYEDSKVLHEQTVQTQIRLTTVFTVCHSFYILWMHWCMLKSPCSNFRIITAIILVSQYLQFLLYLFHSSIYRRLKSWSYNQQRFNGISVHERMYTPRPLSAEKQ